MSDNTSEADLPSTDVPSILRKSLSATPDVKVATLPLDIPELGISDVSATVPAEFGKVTVTSAVDAGPIKVTAFVPLSVSSLNSIDPAADDEPDKTGAVNVLFVSVAVEEVDTNRASPPVLGKVKVLEAASECGAAIIVCP